MHTNYAKPLVVLFTVIGLSGCGHHNSMMMHEENRNLAMQALEAAKAAERSAQTARTIASEASYNAQQAQETANSALQCCNNNSMKIDRMFEKTMMK